MEKTDFGIICAMKKEADGIISNIVNKKSIELFGIVYNYGNIGKHSVAVAVCGIGKVNAAICAQTMISSFHTEVVINTGVGGALNSSLKTGEIVIAETLVQHDLDTSGLGDPIGYISGPGVIFIETDKVVRNSIETCVKGLGYDYRLGVIASGDQFICSKAAKEKIVHNFNADVCEMEGAAVAQVCYIAKVKFCVLRAISDGAEEDAFDSYDAFTLVASEKLKNVILKMLEK